MNKKVGIHNSMIMSLTKLKREKQRFEKLIKTVKKKLKEKK